MITILEQALETFALVLTCIVLVNIIRESWLQDLWPPRQPWLFSHPCKRSLAEQRLSSR